MRDTCKVINAWVFPTTDMLKLKLAVSVKTDLFSQKPSQITFLGDR